MSAEVGVVLSRSCARQSKHKTLTGDEKISKTGPAGMAPTPIISEVHITAS